MAYRTAILALTGLIASGPASAEPIPAGVAAVTLDDSTGYRAVLSGATLDYALPRNGGARRTVVLVAHENAPSALVEVDWETSTLEVLDSRVPRDYQTLFAADLDADGDEELFLGAPGKIAQWSATGPSRGDLEPWGPRFRQAFAPRPLALRPDRQRVLFGEVGKLSLWAKTRNGVQAVRRWETPVRAESAAYGLRLHSFPATVLSFANRLRLGVGPESVGEHRLRTWLYEPNGSTPVECWSAFPVASTLQGSWLFEVEGVPVLIATANSADRVGVFEKQTLHIFRLEPDRTRRGLPPLASFKTAARRWNLLEPFVGNWQGEPRFGWIHQSGLGGGEFRIELSDDSVLHAQPRRLRTATLDLAVDSWDFSQDLDGDSVPDLVLLTEGELRVYRGQSRGKPISRSPVWSFPGQAYSAEDGEREVTLGSDGQVTTVADRTRFGDPVVVDLDGTGGPEVLLFEKKDWGQGEIRLWRVGDPSEGAALGDASETAAR